MFILGSIILEAALLREVALYDSQRKKVCLSRIPEFLKEISLENPSGPKYSDFFVGTISGMLNI